MPLPNGTGEWELFDLKLDPGELNDLAKKHPQKLEELVNRWESMRKKTAYSICLRVEVSIVDMNPNPV